MTNKEVGTVKWLNDSKGFGFITRESGSDLFVHHNSIIADGLKTLKENADVEFDIIKTDKGEAAQNVVAV